MHKKAIYAPEGSGHDRAVHRACAAASSILVVLLTGGALAAETPSKPADKVPPPEEGVARPDAPDLLGGHLLLTLDGGVWTPSSGLFPDLPDLGDLTVGGTAHAHLGIGLNRYLVLGIAGGFARAPALDSPCDDCGAWSIDVGPSLAFRPTQGFAFDPWVSYGAGYRHTILNLSATDETVYAVDVAKLAIGADWYPVALFGVGPYIQTDIGVVVQGEIAGYAAFHAGLRIVFDPMRAGTTLSPAQTAAR